MYSALHYAYLPLDNFHRPSGTKPWMPLLQRNWQNRKNISASQFGVRTEVKVKCRECGIYYFPSTGHTHIHCSHCRGTGRIGTTAKEPSSSMDEYNPESPLAVWGREVASTVRYGLPVSQQEDAAFKSFAQINPEGAKTISPGEIYWTPRPYTTIAVLPC